MRRGLAVVLVALGCVLALSGAAALAAGEEIVVESQPLSSSSPSSWIDPAAAGSSSSLHLINATCLPLLGFDDVTGALVPDAATAMPTVSADGKTYTFTVESGHGFDDVPEDMIPFEAVTAVSFKRAFERATSPAMAASLSPNPPPLRGEVAQIAGAQAFFDGGAADITGISVNGNQISITLVAETAGFLRRLVPYVCATASDAPAGFSSAPLRSAGPYYVVSASDSEIVLEPNPNYGGGRVREPGRIRWAPHGSALVEDYVADAPPTYVAAADALDVRNPTTTIERFILTTHRPPFDSPNLRKAVAFALNRTELSSDSGDLAPTEQLLAPLMPGHERTSVYPLDGSGSDTALALMGGQTPTIDVCYTAGNDSRQALVEAAQSNLEDVGFIVNLQPETAATLFATLLPAGDTCELGLFSLATGSDPGPYLAFQFHSDRIPPGGSNWSFYSDPVLDARMDAAEALRPDATRLAEWGSIDVAITEAAPSVAVGTRFRRDVTADRIGCRYVSHAVDGYPVNRLCVQSVDQEADEGTVYVVTTNGDSEAVGPCDASGCNLREAITAANATIGPDTIVFAIGAGGHQLIEPDFALPEITDPVTIDGTTQPGYTGSPIVEIDGSTMATGVGDDGLLLSGGSSTVRGLVVNGFDAGAGIVLASNESVVEGNYIGTDVAGTSARPNFNGIEVLGSGNTIGGITAGSQNVISGNNATNVRIVGEEADNNVVMGNHIGPDWSGNEGIPNDAPGISITQGADGNMIGGSLDAHNVISGNGFGSEEDVPGVEITGNATTGNNVDSNYIGLIGAGSFALGNSGAGVVLAGVDATSVAGNSVTANFIVGNLGGGVVLDGQDSSATNQSVIGNTIGLNLLSEPVGQPGIGIYINGSSSGSAHGNSILSNTIAGSGDAGVFVNAFNGAATGNTIRFNSIRGSGDLGIDLVEDAGDIAVSGVTQNDAGDADAGSNNLQNFPSLSTAKSDASSTAIEGVLSSTADRPFEIDFYASNACDGSGFGEGETYLDTANVTTNGGGDVEFSESVPFALAPGTQITATATDELTGDTSEFSGCISVAEPSYVVNTNSDGSPTTPGCTATECTLREAILEANGDGVDSSIEFALTETDILLAGPLPAITAPVTIDGTSQGPGTVSIDGTTSGGSGLVFTAGSGGSFVEELVLHDFASGAGVVLQSNGNTVQGLQVSDVDRGIVVENGAAGNDIGGAFDGGAGNLIWDFASSGIELQAAGLGNEIAGNTIGFDSSGAPQTLQPGTSGIFATETAGTVIGHNVGPGGLGAIDGTRSNVIVRTAFGIFFESEVTGSIVAGNFVGVNRTGAATDLGASSTGIELSGASDGNQLGPGIRIAHNGSHGIRINHSDGNRIVANSIHSNGGQGISLNNANASAPTPALDAATRFGSQTRLDVFVEATPGPTYFMEIFTNSSCAPDGEGESFLTFATVTPDAHGEVSAYIGALPVGTLLTVTLTNIATAETSEFSNCFAVLDGGNTQGGPTFTVNTGPDDLTPDDEGCTFTDCTLREAIVAANAVGGPNTIAFAFDGTQIGLNAALPEINRPVVIDGTTQASGVQINGSDAAGDGFVLGTGSSGSTIRGLEFRFFAVTGEAAIRILSSGNTVRGNSIHDVDDGIVVSGGAATSNVVGGSNASGQGNAIWAFTTRGVGVEGAGAGNRVSGNTIGVDPDTVPDAGTIGIGVNATPGTVIGADIGPGGSPNSDLGNVVAGASGEGGVGILVGGGSTGTRVTSNFVGVHRFPSEGLGNSNGILVDDSAKNRIGPGNTVSQNGGSGVEVAGEVAFGNRITRNSIFDNGGQGINLAAGGNNGIAAPTLFSATIDAGTTTFEGEHNGTPGRDYLVEIFSNTTCDSSESGEGETFLVNVTYTATEEFQDFSTVIEGVFPGDVITATVTDVTDPPEDLTVNPADDTSEFSNCVGVSDVAPPPAPILFGAVADATPDTLGVAGLVDSGQPTAGQLFDVQFYSVEACDPIAPRTPLGVGDDFATNATGVAGFAKDGLADVDPGTIVLATASRGGSTSTISNCVVADFNNTSWHTARALTPDDSEMGHLRASGEGRWFKVPVLASSRVDIRLSGLPSDYDLIVFNDIQAAYDEILDGADPARGPNLAIDDLNKQGAETPTDAFNTSQYNPSSWDPTNWEPGLNTSVFSASQWSASQWSASQWSASQWSASQWSASQWSASQWSASQWSESSPAHPKTFADAQTRSLLAVSAGPGTGDESVSVNTWNNTGNFYIRVQGKNGSFDADTPFTLEVGREGNVCSGLNDEALTEFTAPTVGEGELKTLILMDNGRLDLNDTQSGKLAQFAARPEVKAIDPVDDELNAIVDVSSFPALNTLNAQADSLRGCPMAKNLVASGIKKLVDAYRKSNPIEYVVVVGDDDVIPFFRYPDPALLGNETLYTPPVRDDTASQASLRLGYVLSDDFLASTDSISLHGNAFPVPDIAAGRLIETPAEIEGMLDAYLQLTPTNGADANGVVPTPDSSLVTGYDFLQDAADVVGGHLSEGIGPGTHRRLITKQTVSPATTTVGTTPDRDHSWTGDDLRRALLQSGRHDMIFLSGHFSANDALGADFRTNVLSTELPASTVDLTNSIVFSAGCHAGYNIVNDHATEWTEPVDWAQAFARKRATLIAGTGYQYGDTDFLAHSERIYAEFARQLRLTHTAGVRVPVDVGGALLRSKQKFLKLTPGLTALDEKALLQTTLFGFPMLSVNLPQGRFVDPPTDSIVDGTTPVDPGPGADLGLEVKSVENLGSLLTEPFPKSLTGLDVPATWLEGPDGVAVRPTQPILPLRSVDVTSPDPLSALRGVAFRGGSYKDTGGTTPLTAAPATELRGIHAPFFTDVFFPTQPWNVNYFDALGGGSGSTFLHLTPVQHRSESPTMTRRAIDDLDLDLFFSGNVTSYCPDTGLPVPPPPNGCPRIDGRFVTAVTPALAAPPTITGVETSFADGALTFRARAVGDPFAGIQGVWVTWTIPPGVGSTGIWRSLDLVQDETDPTLWTGELVFDGVQGRPAPTANPGDVNFLVQVVNGVGRVTMDHNVGSFYRPGSIPGVGAPPGTPDATELEITVPPPTSVVYRDSFEVTVELTSDGEPGQPRQPVIGKLVRVGIGANGLPAVTDMLGRATVELQAALTPDPDPYTVNATFSGDAMHGPSNDSALVEITKRDTSLVIGGSLTLAPSSVHAILTAEPSAPLDQRTVTLIFTGTGPANVGYKDVFPGKTDPTGRVEVTDEFLALLPAGNYRIDAYFNGVNVPGVLVLPPDSPEYEPATATANLVFRPGARSLLDQAVALLQPLAARPGSAGDKAEDALAKVQSAIGKLSRNNRQGALGDLEGAAGDLQSGVSNRQLTNAQVRPIQELITAAAWVVALEARDRAIARGGRPSKIAEANALINQGNQRWAARAFKDAIARYKDAVAKAESA